MYKRYKKAQEHRHRSNQDRYIHVDVRRDWFVFGITTAIAVATFFVVLVYTIYAKRQAVASEGATRATSYAVTVASNTLDHTIKREAAQDIIDQNARDEAKRVADQSARLAQSSLRANIGIARRDQRAWVGVTKVSAGRVSNNAGFLVVNEVETTLEATVANTGKSPALHVRNVFRMELLPAGESLHPDYSISQKEQSDTVIQPTMFIFPTATFRAMMPAEVDSLRAGHTRLYFYGRLTYNDTFGRSHKTEFCAFVQPDLKIAASCESNNYAN